MTKWPRAALACLLACAGCGGSIPSKNSSPTLSERSALLVKARLFLPSGEIRSGFIDVNLESDAKSYRVRAFPNDTTLYSILPGVYHFAPVRGFFGGMEKDLRVDFNGRVYKIPFPSALLRHDPIVVKPNRAVSIGVLEARLLPVSGSFQPELSFSLIDDATTRKSLVEQVIHKMMDMKVDPEIRENAVVWTRALDLALFELQEAQDAAPTFKPAPR